MSQHISILRIKAVAKALQELNEKVVFIGGATVALYAPKEIAFEARPTDDVDVIIELISYNSYTQLDEKLRSIGFQNDIESGIICRYTVQGIVVDIMPTDASVLGFSNFWYADGFRNAIDFTLDEEITIKIFSPEYFIAAKLEAFKNRGKNDYRTSSDFEDIVYLLENCQEIKEYLSTNDTMLKKYFKTEFTKLLNDTNLEEGIYAHLTPRFAAIKSQNILNLLKEISTL
jgi:predicted nucleotidyltransferase